MPLTDNDNVWRSPLGESMKLRRLDPRNHDHDTHGNFGYKTNREVSSILMSKLADIDDCFLDG